MTPLLCCMCLMQLIIAAFLTPVQFKVVLANVVLLEIIFGSVAVNRYSLLKDPYTESWQTAIENFRVSPDEMGFNGGLNNAVESLQEEVSNAISKRSACGDFIHI